MKKKKDHYLSKSLASATSWALGFFAVFGLALYTYAITYPDTQPNPVSGVVGLFVGPTQAIYNGDSINGYENANSYCADSYDYSHVCTAMEMINTYNNDPDAFNGQTLSYWINNGLPGNTETLSNDCKGWTTQDPKVFGSVWNTSKQQGFLASCGMTRSIACCK